MSTNSRPATVAILAFPEVGVSTVYGMFDMFSSAGRDWGFIVDGKPGDPLIAPRVVAATREPFAAGNGITIHPDATTRKPAYPMWSACRICWSPPANRSMDGFVPKSPISSDATTRARYWPPPARERCCSPRPGC